MSSGKMNSIINCLRNENYCYIIIEPGPDFVIGFCDPSSESGAVYIITASRIEIKIGNIVKIKGKRYAEYHISTLLSAFNTNTFSTELNIVVSALKDTMSYTSDKENIWFANCRSELRQCLFHAPIPEKVS